MDDHRFCRLSVSDGELELAGPPTVLRAVARLLRQHAGPPEVTITGGVVVQEETVGPLLVSLKGEATYRRDVHMRRSQRVKVLVGAPL